MPTTPVGGPGNNNPVKIVDRADPPGVIFNRSLTTQLLWGTTAALANRADASILDPFAVLAVNEDAEIWMVSATPSVQVLVDYHPNGIAFFRGLTNSGGTLLGPIVIADPNGTDTITLKPGTPPSINIATGDAAETKPTFIFSTVIGSGPTRRLGTTIQANSVSGEPAGAFAILQLQSPPVNNPTASPLMSMAVSDGTNSNSLGISSTLSNSQQPYSTNSINAPAATAGTQWYNNASGLMSRALPSGNVDVLSGCQNDATPITVTQAVSTPLTNQWNIPSGDANAVTRYRLFAQFNGTQGSTAQTLEFDLTGFGHTVNGAAIPAAFAAINTNFGGDITGNIVVRQTGNGTAVVDYTYTVTIKQQGATTVTPFSAFGTTSTGQTQAIESMFFSAKWGATTGAPTITCTCSSLERLGN